MTFGWKLHIGPCAFALTLICSPAFAAPCAGFDDVDDSSPFCPNVTWMKNRGVTFGCAANLYCPNHAVSRIQMAAFISRLDRVLPPAVVDANGKIVGSFVTSPRLGSPGAVIWRGALGPMYVGLTLGTDDFSGLGWGTGIWNTYYAGADCTGPVYALRNVSPIVAIRVDGRLWAYRLDAGHARQPLPITYNVYGDGTASTRNDLGECATAPVRNDLQFFRLEALADVQDEFVNPLRIQ